MELGSPTLNVSLIKDVSYNPNHTSAFASTKKSNNASHLRMSVDGRQVP